MVEATATPSAMPTPKPASIAKPAVKPKPEKYMQAVGTEGSGHVLTEEMQRFSDYVAAIEAALPFGKNP